MKNERILEMLAEIEKTYMPEQRADADSLKNARTDAIAGVLKWRTPAPDGLPYIVELFRREAEEDIKREKCRDAGTTDRKKAAESIIAECAQYADERKGAYIGDNGKIIIGGCYRAVRLGGTFEGLTAGEKKMQPDYEKIINGAAQNDGEKIKAPTRKELKDYIKIEKAKHKGERRYKPVYDLGDGRPAVDPQKLLEMIDLIGEDAELTMTAGRAEISQIYIHGENGDGLIMPVKKVKTA